MSTILLHLLLLPLLLLQFLAFPPHPTDAISDLSQLTQAEVAELNAILFNPANLRSYSDDVEQCLRKGFKLFGDVVDGTAQQNFPDMEELIRLVREHPPRAILSILRMEPNGDSLTINHYNALFQCIAKQEDQTECCVDRFVQNFPPDYANLPSYPREHMITRFIPRRNEEAPRAPIATLDRDAVLANMWERQGGRPNNPEDEASAIVQKTREVANQVRITPVPTGPGPFRGPRTLECVKLCNARGPMEQWYYFPLVRSKVCAPLYLTIAYCLVPHGVIKGRAEKDVDYQGNAPLPPPPPGGGEGTSATKWE